MQSPSILGIYCVSNGFEHDHSVCLMKDKHIVKYYPLERLSQVKYDNQLLEKQHLVFNEDCITKKDFTDSTIAFTDSFTDFDINIQDIHVIGDKPSNNSPIKRQIIALSSEINKNIQVFSQEICHVFSNIPFYGSFPDKTLGIHIDGGASYSNRSAWFIHDHGERLEYLGSDWDLHDDVNNFSTNHLTQIILGIFGRRGADLVAPGRLMGLAGYGTYSADLQDWLERHQWFKDTTPRQFLKACQADYRITPDITNPMDPFLANIARVLQDNLTEKVLAYVQKLKDQTQASVLAYAGGVALNIVTNSRIIRELGFREVRIPPCCNDTGIAIGACAVAAFNDTKRGEDTNFPKHSPFLCNSDLDDELGPSEDEVPRLARFLADDQVIGVATGKGEAGPRALGHRSILANPSTRRMWQRVSIEIKHREPYRPLAPIVLEDVASQIFEDVPSTGPVEFMLCDFRIRPTWLDAIPAVTHVDQTARAQIIKDHPTWGDAGELKFISSLLRILWEDYNIPCLINTSFNAAGQPIVHSRADARAFAESMGLNQLVLGSQIIHLKS